jgi:predicted ATP-grasp superfamily ATP-dependent carboligase
MNMFYTGLGIARSLGDKGIPVIGLTAKRGVYGNFTRYARTVLSPDSRSEPEALLGYLLAMGTGLKHRAVIFPTRDDDLVFLDRFRHELSPYFDLAIPESPVLNACLDKWQTYLWARKAGVPAPACWVIESSDDVPRVLQEASFPCVLKPLASRDWRQGDNWEIVGARKAICVSSPAELLSEYTSIARADKRALLQELIPGGDECLMIGACYLDKKSNWVAGFNTRKVIQVPEGFGTGCIVQAANYPDLFDRTLRLLQTMQFTGIAEVEFKWDASKNDYQLIEINPRPWDQHRLGNTCGVDLIHLAYCELAGEPRPVIKQRISAHKWIAEDTFFTTALRLLWKRDPKLMSLMRSARGKRTYAIWSARDPLPSIAYLITTLLPQLIGAAGNWVASRFRGVAPRNPFLLKKGGGL